jgi:hypothetical protein
MSDGRPMGARWVPNGCPMAARWLHDGCAVGVRWKENKCSDTSGTRRAPSAIYHTSIAHPSVILAKCRASLHYFPPKKLKIIAIVLWFAKLQNTCYNDIDRCWEKPYFWEMGKVWKKQNFRIFPLLQYRRPLSLIRVLADLSVFLRNVSPPLGKPLRDCFKVLLGRAPFEASQLAAKPRSFFMVC